MKKQANFGHVLTIIAITVSLIITPLIVWGVSMEKRDQKHTDKIEVIEKNLEKKEARMEVLFGELNKRFDACIEKINTVHIEMQNKQNRKE